MSLVSNASPLIFLSKIDELALPRILFQGPYLIPKVVYEEVSSSANEVEKTSLLKEWKYWKIRELHIKQPLTGAGSTADWSVFQLARIAKAGIVLVDDKYLRGLLFSANISVLGTLGLLTLAAQKKVLKKKKVIELGTMLIEKHNLWVDALTYRKFIKGVEAPHYTRA